MVRHNGHGHWRQVVEAGDHLVKLSGLLYAPQWASSRNKLNGKGVYLSRSWSKLLKEDNPYIVYGWPDMKTVPVEEVHGLVLFLVRLMKMGIVPEIACIGGHGRTGTLYSCLLVYLEGLTPRQAVIRTWNNYCESAVETLGQMKLVYKYGKYLESKKV